jgi:hypothetical protein
MLKWQRFSRTPAGNGAGLIAGHSALDRCHYTLAKIKRVRLAYPCWPPPSQHGGETL